MMHYNTQHFSAFHIIFLYLAQVATATNVPIRLYDHPETQALEPKCQPFNSPFCDITMTVQPFKNTLGHTSLEEAIGELHKAAYLLSVEPCKSKIQLFLCSLYVPICVNSTPTAYIPESLLLPCRDDCEQALQVCAPTLASAKEVWKRDWDCKRFNYLKDDPLCVINNAQAPDLPIRTNESEHMCGKDMFDCRIRDPLTRNHALCIEHSYVCDNKIDCSFEGIDPSVAGLDELNCRPNCSSNQIACDGKCLAQDFICNGVVDCSTGVDELDCEMSNITALVQSIICLLTFLSAIYLLVRFCQVDDSPTDNPSPYNSAVKVAGILHEQQVNQAKTGGLPDDRLIHSGCVSDHSIYQEPTDSLQSRNDYERLNVGGCSGASSVYACPIHIGRDMLDLSSEPPAPPPPTPALQQIYSGGSTTKSVPIYMNSWKM